MFGVKKKQGEDSSNDRLLRKFRRGLKEARYLLKLKKERFFKKMKTKKQTREAAISRTKYQKQRAKEKFIS